MAVHDTGVSVRAPLRVILPDGRLLAEIAAEPLPRVHVFSPQGNLAASLGVFANGAPYGGGLAVYDHAGKRVGHLNVETYGARLILGSSGDNGGVVLFGGDVAEENGGGIHLIHRNGEVGISLWAGPTGAQLSSLTQNARWRERASGSRKMTRVASSHSMTSMGSPASCSRRGERR